MECNFRYSIWLPKARIQADKENRELTFKELKDIEEIFLCDNSKLSKLCDGEECIFQKILKTQELILKKQMIHDDNEKIKIIEVGLKRAI